MFLILSTILTPFITAVVFLYLHKSCGRFGSLITGCGAVLLVLMMMSGFIVVQLLLLGVVGLFMNEQTSDRTRVLAAAGASFLAWASFLGLSLNEYFQALELREQYPVVSLEGRLAYETADGPQSSFANNPSTGIGLEAESRSPASESRHQHSAEIYPLAPEVHE